MPTDYTDLARRIKGWTRELGFNDCAIADTDLAAEEPRLTRWLEQGCHGGMGYMARHGLTRARPAELQPGTLRVVSVRLDYLPAGAVPLGLVLRDGERAAVARYAVGRDYHKLMRRRLAQLARRIEEAVGPVGSRPFVDSAPVLEKPLGAKGGLGWVGKHSNLLARDGSWFFLGELFVALPLPVDAPVDPHCGHCTACIERCPTAAIVEPYKVDARRCISYLTIEHFGPIPLELRPLIGNRVYGCDDCQLACPWNRFATPSREAGFAPRHGLDAPRLVELFAWDEATFLKNLEGSPIRRIGHERWLRNLAVALGNGPATAEARAALTARTGHPSELVREHVAWAIARLHSGLDDQRGERKGAENAEKK
ncbi:tRNA epoxyqueuosine(34) reductase QueG [Endothiovibrio diazotrophicus]